MVSVICVSLTCLGTALAPSPASICSLSILQSTSRSLRSAIDAFFDFQGRLKGLGMSC